MFISKKKLRKIIKELREDAKKTSEGWMSALEDAKLGTEFDDAAWYAAFWDGRYQSLYELEIVLDLYKPNVYKLM